jgi:hypothetical protein
MTKNRHDRRSRSHQDSARTEEPAINWQNAQLDFGQVAFFHDGGYGFLSSLFHSSRDHRKHGSVFFHINQVKARQARQTLEASRGNSDVNLYFWFTVSYAGQKGFQADALWLGLQEFSGEALSAALGQLIETINRTSPPPRVMKALCTQLFGDPRISDDRLSTLFTSKYFKDNPDEVAAFLRASQYTSYTQHLDLPSVWRDISRILPGWAERITEQLLGAEQLKLLQKDRQALQDMALEEERIAEERRRQERETRLREQKAAEARRREEETRQAQAWAEQEERNRLELAARYPRLGGRRADGQRPLKTNWGDFAAVMEQFNISCLYHFTDRSNLESIQQHGGLYSWFYLESNGIAIPKAGGGELSRRLDSRRGLQDYVRLSFNSKQPMLYVAQQEGHISDPVILEIDPQVIFWEDTWFSNINAATFNKGTPIIGPGFEHFQSIRFDIATKRSWSGELQKGLFQAEVMVKTHIPLTYILNFNQICQPVAHVAAWWR